MEKIEKIDVAAVAKAYYSGKSIHQLAEKYGVVEGTVRMWIAKAKDAACSAAEKKQLEEMQQYAGERKALHIRCTRCPWRKNGDGVCVLPGCFFKVEVGNFRTTENSQGRGK